MCGLIDAVTNTAALLLNKRTEHTVFHFSNLIVSVSVHNALDKADPERIEDQALGVLGVAGDNRANGQIPGLC